MSDPKRMRVKARKTLFWPASLVGRANTDARGVHGYIVDWSLPHERDWCAGQEYKLEPAEDSAIPDPVEMKQAVRFLRSLKPAEPPKTMPEQLAENDQASAEAAEAEQPDLPGVAPAPKRKGGSR